MKSLVNVRLFMVMSLFFYAGNAVGMDADMAGEKLYYAVNLRNIENVENLIAAGANVNWRDNNNNYTPLFIASIKGYLEIVQDLVAAGADVNIRDNSGFTALMWACSYGYVEIVQALIAAGADSNMPDNYGYTSLMRAIVRDNLDMVQVLVAAGADVNATNDQGRTTLMLAVRKGRLDIIQAIINADGLDLDQLQPIVDDLAAKENKTAVEQQIIDILEHRQIFNPMGLK